LFSRVLLVLFTPLAQAQKTAWRQATDAELASLIAGAGAVEKEHIETEMRTASGIVNGRGHYVAGVVLITAGYSADGSIRTISSCRRPSVSAASRSNRGEYVFGWVRTADTLSVRFTMLRQARWWALQTRIAFPVKPR